MSGDNVRGSGFEVHHIAILPSEWSYRYIDITYTTEAKVSKNYNLEKWD